MPAHLRGCPRPGVTSPSAPAPPGRLDMPATRPAAPASARPVSGCPDLPGRQGVELLPMIAAALMMLPEQPLDHLRAEETFTPDRFRRADVPQQRGEFSPKPPAQGDPEALLRTGDDVIREQPPHRALERILGREAPELEPRRQGRRQPDHAAAHA